MIKAMTSHGFSYSLTRVVAKIQFKKPQTDVPRGNLMVYYWKSRGIVDPHIRPNPSITYADMNFATAIGKFLRSRHFSRYVCERDRSDYLRGVEYHRKVIQDWIELHPECDFVLTPRIEAQGFHSDDEEEVLYEFPNVGINVEENEGVNVEEIEETNPIPITVEAYEDNRSSDFSEIGMNHPITPEEELSLHDSDYTRFYKRHDDTDIPDLDSYGQAFAEYVLKNPEIFQSDGPYDTGYDDVVDATQNILEQFKIKYPIEQQESTEE